MNAQLNVGLVTVAVTETEIEVGINDIRSHDFQPFQSKIQYYGRFKLLILLKY